MTEPVVDRRYDVIRRRGVLALRDRWLHEEEASLRLELQRLATAVARVVQQRRDSLWRADPTLTVRMSMIRQEVDACAGLVEERARRLLTVRSPAGVTRALTASAGDLAERLRALATYCAEEGRPADPESFAGALSSVEQKLAAFCRALAGAPVARSHARVETVAAPLGAQLDEEANALVRHVDRTFVRAGAQIPARRSRATRDRAARRLPSRVGTRARSSQG